MYDGGGSIKQRVFPPTIEFFSENIKICHLQTESRNGAPSGISMNSTSPPPTRQQIGTGRGKSGILTDMNEKWDENIK